MDTVVSETLYTTGDDLNTAIGQKIRDIETEYLSWTDEDSQIAKLNAASGETTEVSDELAGYLEKIFQLAKDSNGAFDPTIGKIIRLWNITGENPHVPEQSELDELLKDVGYQKVSLDGDKVTLEKGATLDLGATGKGIGCDVVSDFLKTQEDVSGMILNLGGSSVMAYGEKPDGSDWKVAVTDLIRVMSKAITLVRSHWKVENSFRLPVTMKNILWKMVRDIIISLIRRQDIRCGMVWTL